MNKIRFGDFEPGSEIPPLRVEAVGHMGLVRYAGASGDFNPIHTDPGFAKSVGLDGTIVHGMYVMAQLGRLWSGWVPPSQVRSFSTKFKGMTRPGEALLCTGKIKRKKEENGEKLLYVELEAANESGEVKASGDLVVVCEE